MVIAVTNAQREAPIDHPRMERLARRAVRQLRIRARGTLTITFIDSRRMRALNNRFLGHDRVTDVLSFRYDDVRSSGFGVRSSDPQPSTPNPEPVIGEILVAPRLARTYAAAHGIRYDEELSRYVVHGILHWLGHEDKTAPQQRRMRKQEDRLLTTCGIRLSPPTPNSQPRTVSNGHSRS